MGVITNSSGLAYALAARLGIPAITSAPDVLLLGSPMFWASSPSYMGTDERAQSKELLQGSGVSESNSEGVEGHYRLPQWLPAPLQILFKTSRIETVNKRKHGKRLPQAVPLP